MSLSKLEKYLERPLFAERPQTRHAILISTSKGNYIKPHQDILSYVGYSLEFVCRPGARFPQHFYWLQRNLSHRVHIYHDIVLFVWLGTCDLTEKEGKFIKLRHTTDDEAVTYLIRQIERFLSFVAHFPSVEIVFLEIPPYSIVEWNKYKGHTDSLQYYEDDFVLNRRVDLINEFIRNVNASRDFCSPRYKLDLLQYRKRKNRQQRAAVSFKLYKDGVHPGEVLARYWMRRLVEKILQLC